MDIRSSRARLPPVPPPPPGLPPGPTAPTGPRLGIPTKKLPPGPLKLGNRQIPSVLSPVPLVKITYEEAIEDILEQTGSFLTKLKSMPPIKTSVVLHDPRGGVLKATEGLLLQSDVSLCYLITWLQIFADNYVAKYHTGNDLVVRSVEIRFHNKQSYTSYPNLEGGLSYFNVNGVAVASINWPCGNSSMERYWEAFRSMMQLGSDDHIKYPIIKVRTVKYQAGGIDGMGINKRLGGGHVFVVGEKDLDAQRYYDHHGQPMPDALIQLDSWLTESENEQLPQSNVRQQRSKRETHPIQVPSQGTGTGGDGYIGVKEPQHDQKSDTNLTSFIINPGGRADGLTTIGAAPVRPPPSQMVSVPIGNHTMDIPVPFRPSIHPDPKKNWRKFQRSGGVPQLHNAFPLDHVVYDPKDMPQFPTPPPIMGNLTMQGSQYNQQNGGSNNTLRGDDKKVDTNYQPINANNNGASSYTTREMEDPYEAAVGFSSDDDETFFPARNMREDARTADINRIPKPLHRHAHRPSQNEIPVKNIQELGNAAPGIKDPAPSPAEAHSTAPSKTELASKKFTSTMNVNAPEFVHKSSTAAGSGLEFMMNPLAPGFDMYNALPETGFAPITNLTSPPIPANNLTPLMAVPGYYDPYTGQFQPGLPGDPNFWALSLYGANPLAAPLPAAGSSRPHTANTTRSNYWKTRGGQAHGNITQSNTINDITREVAQQTLGVTIRRDAKGKGHRTSKGDEKNSTKPQSNNQKGSKGQKEK